MMKIAINLRYGLKMTLPDKWKEEKRSAYVYQKLSEIETNPVHKKLFLNLSFMADKQAAIWAKKMDQGVSKSALIYQPDIRTKLIIKLVHCFGAKSLRIALAAMKIRGMSIYHLSPPEHPIPEVPHQMEHTHRSISQGNNIRAAIFGIN